MSGAAAENGDVVSFTPRAESVVEAVLGGQFAYGDAPRGLTPTPRTYYYQSWRDVEDGLRLYGGSERDQIMGQTLSDVMRQCLQAGSRHMHDSEGDTVSDERVDEQLEEFLEAYRSVIDAEYLGLPLKEVIGIPAIQTALVAAVNTGMQDPNIRAVDERKGD